MPFWMKASWFKKMGYEKIDRNGMLVLLWKPFTDDAVPPRLIRPQKKPPVVADKVAVTCFRNGWCPAQNLICERAKRAAHEVGDSVVVSEIDTSDKATLREWGISDALFVDQKEMRTGPPPSYEKVRKVIAKRAKRLRSTYSPNLMP